MPRFRFPFCWWRVSEKSDSSKGIASAKDETKLLVKFILTRIRLRLRRRLLRHSTTSFSWNVVVEETSHQMLEFYHFATWRGLNLLSSIKSTVPTFLVKKKQSGEASRGVYIFFEKTQKNFKSNLVLVVVLILESKCL